MLTQKYLALVLAACAITTGCIFVDGDADDEDGIGGFSEGGFGEGGSTDNATGGFGGGSVDCLDDAGFPETCFTDCEGVSNCTGISYFKDGVAEYLVSCLNTLNPATCTFIDDVINICTIDALSAACFDDVSESYCSEIADGCGLVDDGQWQDSCGPYLDGLNDDGKTAVASCQIEECDLGGEIDLGSCLFVLYP